MSADTLADNVTLPEPDPDSPEAVKAKSAAGDTAPKRRGRPPGSKNKTPRASSGPARKTSKAASMAAETAELGKALGMLLAVPAIPAQMVGDAYLVAHFNTAGPQLGQVLAEASERNLVLRQWLMRAMAGESVAVLAIGIVGYVVPPAVYFLTPPDSPMRGAFGVPPPQPRGGVASPNGSHPQSTESAGPSTVPGDTAQ